MHTIRDLRHPNPLVPRSARFVAAFLVALALSWSGASGVAGASTVNGTATVATPGTTTELSSGGSTTQFTVALAASSLGAPASCTGDTAKDGYHVYSYMVPKGTAITSVTFVGDLPSTGYGLVNTLGTYYGPVNTAVTTGQIIGIPNDFEWAPLVNTDGGSVTLAKLLYTGSGATATGVWEVGLACATEAGTLSDNWNTQVTFSASSSDPNGFTWSAVPGAPAGSITTTTTTTSTTTTTTAPTTTTPTNQSGTPSATTTTTAAPTTTAATDTTPAADTSAGDDGSASDPGTGSSGSTGSGSDLAYTGIDLPRDVGIGVLCLGLACLLLGWGYRRRARRVAARTESHGW